MCIEKEQKLIKYLQGYKQLALAYSGGVDSTYLADVIFEVLGLNAQMIIADSPSIPRTELAFAVDIAKQRGWNLRVIKTNEHKKEAYLLNQGDRCYHCKKELFTQMQTVLDNATHLVLAHGAIEDDRAEIRPGTKAASESSVIAPLQEVKLYKSEIRKLSKLRLLPTSNKASFACLGSRFPTGVKIDLDTMRQIEMAEEILRKYNFYQYRVRHHGEICRIEIDPKDFEKLMLNRVDIVTAIKKTGYRYVSLDLDGYVTGSTA